MTKLETISCEEIMTQPLKPIEFFVDNLITQGLSMLSEKDFHNMIGQQIALSEIKPEVQSANLSGFCEAKTQCHKSTASRAVAILKKAFQWNAILNMSNLSEKDFTL